MNLRLSSVAVVLSSLVAVGCSGGDKTDPAGGTTPAGGGTTDPPATTSPGTPTPAPTTSPTPPTATGTGTWTDGMALTTNLDIVAGATVTIAPGAKITVSDGVTITVHGTLTAAAKADHASLTGASWGGIVVASGGTLTLSGVDLGGAGIQANAGDTKASYDYGTMTSGKFTVDKGATLDTDHAAVVMGGATTVSGAFTATFLDYAGASISLGDMSATVSIADSKLTGKSPDPGNDFFIADGGALLHVEYSVVTNSHCPFHFDSLTKYTFDHVATRANGYGLMLYNSETTPNTISFSSFEDPNFDQTGRANEIDIDNSYIKPVSPARMTVGIFKITKPASGPVTAAAPRGTPGPG